MSVTIKTSQLPTGVVGQPYYCQLEGASDPPRPFSWTCDNDLPSDLVLNGDTGILSGVCNQPFLGSLTLWLNKQAFKTLNLFIGEAWSTVLLRDCLQEDSPSAHEAPLPSTSPDIICMQDKETTPQRLIESYASDSNLSIIPGTSNNFYIRGRNMGSAPGSGGIYLYWCRSSLFLLPHLWLENAITPMGAVFPQTRPGQVAVTDIPFPWIPPALPPGQTYSLVCAATSSSCSWKPTEIPSFFDWSAFLRWTSSFEGHLCSRSIWIVSSAEENTLTRMDLLDYPFQTPTVMLLQAEMTNVPIQTTVILKNEALGINHEEILTSQNQRIFSQGATCPPGFNGNIETTVLLPQGQSWPAKARITTTLYFGIENPETKNLVACRFTGYEHHPHLIMARELISKSGQGRLVSVGTCTTVIGDV